MKRNNRFTKRFLALFLVLCFVLSQINLPAGLIKITPDFSFLHTKAVGETFTLRSSDRYYPIMYEITGSDTVTAISYDVDALNANPSNHILFFADDDGTITNPETNKKYKVTAIDGKFGGLDSATAVVIPKTVVSIGDGSFSNNTGINALYFQVGTQCESIGNQAFYNCTNLLSSNLQDYQYYSSLSADEASYYADTACNPDTKSKLKILSLPSSLTSIGEEAFYKCTKLTHIDFEGTATTIGDKAFYQCNKLVTVTLPKSTTSLGASSFELCTALVAVTLSDGLTEIKERTFNGCSSLCSLDVTTQRTKLFTGSSDTEISTKLTIPSKVIKIGDYAFANTKFTELIPSVALTSIGDYAFSGAGSLANIEFSVAEQLTTIGDYAFSSCTSLGGSLVDDTIWYWTIVPPDSLSTIGKYAFANCGNMINFRFASGTNITTIDEGAFSGSGVGSFSLPDTITEISPNLFQNCPQLTMVSISRELTTIGDYAFQNDTGFSLLQTRNGAYSGYASTDPDAKPLNTPDNDLSYSAINKIGAYSFAGTNLTTFDLPSGVTEIPTAAFYKCVKLTSFTFHGSTLTYMGNQAFSGCSVLKTISIPSGITKDNLGIEIFKSCSNLTSVTFGEDTSFTAVTQSMFEECSNLTALSLPQTVMSIDGSAFKNCSALETVNNIANVTIIGTSAFENCSNFIGFDLTSESGMHDLSLPAGLTTLGSSAFSGCSSIQTIKELGMVSSIPSSAFKNCTALAEVVFPVSLKTINTEAFINAPITKMTFLEVTAPTLLSLTKPCFSETIANNVEISCYIDIVDDLSTKFKSIGITIPTSHFHPQERPGGDVYQTTDTITSLTVGKSQTLKKGTHYGSLTADGSESSDIFSWSSSDSSIASVDATTSGQITITAVDVGTATITGVTQCGAVIYTITIQPSSSNVIDNAYDATYVIYDISDTTNLLKAPVVYSGDSAIPTSTDYQAYLYANASEGKTITLKAVGKHEGTVTTDNFYWSTTSTTIELGTAGYSVESEIGGQKCIVGDTVTITPTTESGSATVNITTKTAKKATITYKIGNKLTALKYGTKAPNGEIMIATGSSLNLATGTNYIVKEPTTSLEKVTWRLENEYDEEVLTITEAGVITTKSIGNATVIATSDCSNLTIKYVISVINPINATTITNINEGTNVNSNSTINVFPGDTINLNLSWIYKDSTIPSVDYLNCEIEDAQIASIESSTRNDNYVTVSVKANAIGKTKLNFTPTSEVTTGAGYITINVQQPITDITVKEGSETKAVGVNDTISLKNCFNILPTGYKDIVTYESNNTSVATIDASGTATGVSPGSCIITAKCARTNIEARMTLTVTNTVTAATATPSSIGSDKNDLFYPGASKTISLELTAKDATLAIDSTAIIWSSTNEAVATVTGSGSTATVTAIKAGSATIKATNALGTSLCSISVRVTAPSIKLERSNVTLYKKIKKRKTYTIKPIIAGNSKKAKYSSSKKKIATVSSAGKVTAKKKGTTVITITANGVSTKLNVTVDTKTKAKLTVNNSAGTIKKNAITVKKSNKTCKTTYKATWQVLSATYKSSKKKVATIDKNGNIKLKKKGTTKITITVDGIKKTYTLRVK